jgi:hypothetical protein
LHFSNEIEVLEKIYVKIRKDAPPRETFLNWLGYYNISSVLPTQLKGEKSVVTGKIGYG